MKKTKLKIYSISNSEKHSYFLIEKKQAFVDLLRGFLDNLGFETMYTAHLLIEMDKDHNEKDIKLSRLKEYHEYAGNKNYDIDIFIGKRIHLIINTAAKNRNKVVDELMKFCEFAKYKAKKKKKTVKRKKK